MADEAEKPKKNMLSKTFNGATKFAVWGFPLAVASSLMFDPTWLLIFHDTSNVMAQAWITKVTPFMDWLPRHLGLTPEDGLMTPFMEWFLEDELAARGALSSSAESVEASAISQLQSTADLPIPGLT